MEAETSAGHQTGAVTLNPDQVVDDPHGKWSFTGAKSPVYRIATMMRTSRSFTVFLMFAAPASAEPPTPPGYDLTWGIHNRRLAAHGVGSREWNEFPATLCMTSARRYR